MGLKLKAQPPQRCFSTLGGPAVDSAGTVHGGGGRCRPPEDPSGTHAVAATAGTLCLAPLHPALQCRGVREMRGPGLCIPAGLAGLGRRTAGGPEPSIHLPKKERQKLRQKFGHFKMPNIAESIPFTSRMQRKTK